MVITEELLDKVSTLAKKSSRLRMNYNLHEHMDDKTHRFLVSVRNMGHTKFGG